MLRQFTRNHLAPNVLLKLQSSSVCIGTNWLSKTKRNSISNLYVRSSPPRKREIFKSGIKRKYGRPDWLRPLEITSLHTERRENGTKKRANDKRQIREGRRKQVRRNGHRGGKRETSKGGSEGRTKGKKASSSRSKGSRRCLPSATLPSFHPPLSPLHSAVSENFANLYTVVVVISRNENWPRLRKLRPWSSLNWKRRSAEKSDSRSMRIHSAITRDTIRRWTAAPRAMQMRRCSVNFNKTKNRIVGYRWYRRDTLNFLTASNDFQTVCRESTKELLEIRTKIEEKCYVFSSVFSPVYLALYNRISGGKIYDEFVFADSLSFAPLGDIISKYLYCNLQLIIRIPIVLYNKKNERVFRGLRQY